MLKERREAKTPERTFINIIINRASLGDAEQVFAKIQSVDGEPNYPTYVPRVDIIVNEQPLDGQELSAKLAADIIDEHDNYYLVEIEGEKGCKVRLRVNKKEGKIEPVSHKATFKEDMLAPQSSS